MLNQSKKLTDGLIVYSVLLSGYEKMDFKNDALAGVRANYFNSSCTEQKNKTEVIFENKTYNLAYQMKERSTISWKITRNNQPYQSVKKATGGVYSVIFYGDNGIVYKRQYFDIKHIWLRTEYFDKSQQDVLVAVISPKNIFGVVALHLEEYNENGDKKEFDLFPSSDISKTNSSALVYSNCGMLWYDTSFKPEDMPDFEEKIDEINGFIFNTENSDNNNYVDFNAAASLDEDNFEHIEEPVDLTDITQDLSEDKSTQEKEQFSAYEQIEKILAEAHKTNKDLFGEIISQTSDIVDDGVEENNQTTVEADIAESSVETETVEIDTEIENEVSADTLAEILEDISDEDSIEDILIDVDKSEENEIIDEIILEENTSSDIIDEHIDAVVDTDISEDEEVFELENNSLEEITVKNEVLAETVEDDLITDNIIESDEVKKDDLTDVVIEDEVETVEALEDLTMSETEDDTVKTPEIKESVDKDILEEVDAVESVKDNEYEECDNTFEIGKAKPCDVVIVTKAGRYSYFGKIDENNCRTGRGRTVTPDGYTSYDGEYKNDKKDGFGVCYYKNGEINYVGNWSENNRSGCGVGYRQSDGTMHIGKWDNNKPQNMGARFDSEGNFLDISNYENGVKNGKSVSFDDNGNIIISMWKNGEKTSETLIKSEDLYG